MKFCTNCGAKMEGGSVFCIQCGANNSRAVPDTQSPGTVNIQAPASAPKPQKGGSNAPKGITAAISALIIAAMLMGWFSVHIDISPRGFAGQLIAEFMPREIMDMLRDDLQSSTTIYDLNNQINALEMFFDMTESAIRADPWSGPDDLNAFRAVTQPVSTASTAISAVQMAIAVSILLITAFLFLMSSGSKIAGLVGQIAFLAAFLTALVFVIAMAVLNSIVSGLVDIAGMAAGFSFVGITLGATIWVWLTMALAVAGFLIISMRKSIINGR